MDTPNLKLLKKLADSCRKAGISQFKGFGYEFTLSDALPQRKSRKSKGNQVSVDNTPDPEFQSDSLSQEALLFWSSGDSGNSDEQADS